MSLDYDQYLHEHIENVNHGLRWMADNLKINGVTERDISDAIWKAADHDKSKYDDAEYDAYDAYFYGGNRSYQVVQDFNRAWLHHIHENPHHWQHWVLIQDDPEEDDQLKNDEKEKDKKKNYPNNMLPLEMPVPDVLEMIADWWAFSWKDGNLFEIFEWYADHENTQFLHKNTRKLVEDILNAIQDVLEMQQKIENPYRDEDEIVEHSDKDDEAQKYGLPEVKKFPMPDAKHVRSAIKFFNYATPSQEETLAKAILARMEEYGMSFDDFEVGEDNRFKNYIPKKDEESQ